MAYTPSTLTIVSWSSPLTIQPYDLISGLDDAVNSIVSTHGSSLRNFMNTELAKIPTYLSSELTAVYNETNASAVSAAASAVTAANTVAPFTSHLADTANPHTVTKAQVGLGNCDNTTDLLKPISTATQTALDLKSPLASPTFTGTVGGITKAMVGLTNADNTSDVNKPVSTAQQTAINAVKVETVTHSATSKATPIDADEIPLIDSVATFGLKRLTWANLKTTLGTLFAPLASPTLTGTPTAPTATAGTNTTQLATTSFAKTVSEANAIGVNQTWQNVAGSRASGTTYTNSTGKSINVVIAINTNAGYYLSVSGIATAYTVGNASVPFGSLSAIVPNGATYVFGTGGVAINMWAELR